MFEPGFKDSSSLTNAQHMQLRPIFLPDLGWAVTAACTSNCMSLGSNVSLTLAALASANCEAYCGASL